MPKWIGELSSLRVLKGFVAGSVSKKKQSCRLRDLSKFKYLRKLSIRISKHLDPEDARGLESMDGLSVLTVIWGINEHNNEDEWRKVQMISFPKNLEKLDIRCYPEAEAAMQLNPRILPKLKRLYIRGGRLAKIENDFGWEVLEILRLRFLEYLEMDWSELHANFTKLEYVEYERCPRLKNFPENRTSWNMEKDQPFSDGADEPLKEYISGGVQLKIIHKPAAPLAKNEKKLILQLTGSFIRNGPGLDIVAVLDVSRSMKADNKLEKMKTAILFVLNNLSSLDHFTIVVYSAKARKLYPLQQITKSYKKELERMVNNLKAKDTDANIFDGLQIALDCFRYVNVSIQTHLVKSVILVSGGMLHNHVDKAAQFDLPFNLGHWAVHTFGFGKNHNPMVLKSIAYGSKGGTYSDVRNMNNLTKAFAVYLAGNHSVAAQDLTLSLNYCRPRGSVGGYQRYNKYLGNVNDGGSINFGVLYCEQVLKVLVNLNLPAIEKERVEDALRVSYSYKSSVKYTLDPSPVIIGVKRMQTVPANAQYHRDIIFEETRLKIVEVIKEATTLADDKKLESARAKIIDAQNILKDVEINLGESDESFVLLKAELKELVQMMESEEIYIQRRAFAYSLLTSHDRQRAVARGDDIEKFLLFATPSTFKFLKQAENFDVDRGVPSIPVDEDVE